MRSTAHLFPRLLSNLKVMLYQGYLSPSSTNEDNLIFAMVLPRKQRG